MDRCVYSSRRMGERRGPFMKGEASFDDSGIPNNSAWRNLTTVPAPTASVILPGTSFLFNNPQIPSPPSFSSSSPSSGITTTFTASLLPPALLPEQTSLTATFTASSTSPSPSLPSNVQIIPPQSLLPLHTRIASRALPRPPPPPSSSKRLDAGLPTMSTAPPAADMDRRDSSERDTTVVSAGETTHHFTAAPFLAQETVATSPTPPGGEITMMLGEKGWV
mmetsp:Transcript_29362/g.35767  ORF Transcript_29362/g.35767 Transcript_29362/m.35767 type:complete len:221 (-) Transcript_29362:249-911(-)